MDFISSSFILPTCLATPSGSCHGFVGFDLSSELHWLLPKTLYSSVCPFLLFLTMDSISFPHNRHWCYSNSLPYSVTWEGWLSLAVPGDFWLVADPCSGHSTQTGTRAVQDMTPTVWADSDSPTPRRLPASRHCCHCWDFLGGTAPASDLSFLDRVLPCGSTTVLHYCVYLASQPC